MGEREVAETPINEAQRLAARRPLRVLIVDDEPRFLESLRLALDGTYLVETQKKGPEAMALVEADPARFDVVLCDLSMPEIDGVAFYERMQKLGVADRFVLMTGGAYTPRAAEFVARNVCPTMGKPFLLERLFALLEAMTPAHGPR